MATRVKKKNFSSFTYAEAFKYLGIEEIIPWKFSVEPIASSEFFQENLRQISEVFDLQSSEESKKLLIDAICQESVRHFKQLKIWKAAPLSDERTTGHLDYLLAKRRAYLEAPLLCIVEAKKDDFEQGLAQCLPAMKACQYQLLGQNLDIYGIVTNGEGWRFYKLTPDGLVYGSELYAIGNLPQVLGILNIIFEQCEQNLLAS
ncbi:hypothetical protein [Thermosynechococcus sp.]|uniref:hypothetical protein n=1 Tax=Thermosynechococcus sp. TaxID=2814275 RepID=UPI0039189A1A